MTALNHSVDPTLAALDDLHTQASGSEAPRRYLGASLIGQECRRRIWYSFRWALPRAFPATSYRAIQDGHRGEAVMVAWLRSLPDIQLWTEDPDQPGGQIGFTACAGHFRGHLDGIILGLYQAPKTPHVWEHKVCNETKWNKLVKLIQEHGEKAALLQWDAVYYAQAQIYMHQMDLTRHYLTVGTPGNRKLVSCRTEYRATDAKAILKKAEQIITSDRPPLKLSDDPTWYQCKLCDYHALCHGAALPAVNCRTCAHSTARLDEARPWTCELKQSAITGNQAGCDHHAFHPDLLANHAEAIAADPKTGVITFRRNADGATWDNGINGLNSADWRAQAQQSQQPQGVAASPLPAERHEPSLIEADTLAQLAREWAMEPDTLQAGQLTESDWDRLPAACKRLSAAWSGDDQRNRTLSVLLEQIDAQYMQLAERTMFRGATA